MNNTSVGGQLFARRAMRLPETRPNELSEPEATRIAVYWATSQTKPVNINIIKEKAENRMNMPNQPGLYSVPFSQPNSTRLHEFIILRSGIFGGTLRFLLPLVSAAYLIATGGIARASIAYGSLNNFDCVNDTGVEAHGFDIELDDVRSKDITYTYDYNHYGVPRITEDISSVPGHTNVLVRYSAAKTNGVWSAYTAVPSGPIAPTQGHQFTDPSVNFGGEHFGVGYYGAPSAVKYNWLIDDGTGNLVHGPPVNVATPTFTYNPPVAAAPANVVAVIVPPPPPAPPVLQFGDASWVKEIKTSTHSTNKVELVDLVGDDPGQPQPWANGEPAEVEIEWRILQTEFAAANGGANGELQGAPEDLPGGDEVITRRYEFYKYTGPLDVETGQAVADAVGPDGIHGVGSVTYVASFDPATGEPVAVTLDLSNIVVVGDFFGAQMSGFDVAPKLGLIDHLQDGEVNAPYPERTVIVAGGAPFLATLKSGSLPDGMTLDSVTGVLSGTPTVAGAFTFAVEASDTTSALVSNAYTVTIAGGVVPATFTISTSALPLAGGMSAGDGSYNSDSSVTVTATPDAGYTFVNWTEGGATVSVSASYQFVINANRSLVATFAPITYTVATTALPGVDGTTTGDGSYEIGSSVTVTATPNAGYAFVDWTEGGVEVSTLASFSFAASANRSMVARFTPVFNVIAWPSVLWPASHKMAPVTLGVVSADSSLQGKIVGVSMNEPADKTTPDWVIGGDLKVWLRAERNTKSNGRVYTITVQCTDASGNTSLRTATVTVPKNARELGFPHLGSGVSP